MRLGIILVGTAVVTVVGTVTWVSLARVPPLPAESQHVPREDSCGPISLWYAAERSGVPLSSAQLDSFFADGSFGGTTLAELTKAAEQFGLEAKAGSFDWEQLAKHDGTAILFVEEDHFVAADPREREIGEATNTPSIRVYDTKRAAAIRLTQPELQAIWNGDALLLSARRREKNQGPVLACDYSIQDVGLLRDPLKVNYRFPVRNEGNEALTLKVQGTSCTCTTAAFTNPTLEPGDEGFLDVEFSLKSTEGRFGGLVVAETNDPRRRNVSYHLRGAVYRTNLLSTQSVLLGRVDPGSRKSPAIVAMDPGDGRLKVTDVKSELTVAVANSPSQPECQISVTPYREVEPLLRKAHNLSFFDSLVTLQITTPANCAPGNFEFNCIVGTNQEKTPSMTVVVQGSVLPDLVAEPQALILQLDDKTQVIDTQVTIRSRSGTAITDLQSTMIGQLSLDGEHCEYHAASVNLQLQVAVPQNAGADWNDGSLICTASDGRLVEIPLLVSGAKNTP